MFVVLWLGPLIIAANSRLLGAKMYSIGIIQRSGPINLPDDLLHVADPDSIVHNLPDPAVLALIHPEHLPIGCGCGLHSAWG